MLPLVIWLAIGAAGNKRYLPQEQEAAGLVGTTAMPGATAQVHDQVRDRTPARPPDMRALVLVRRPEDKAVPLFYVQGAGV